MDNAQAYAASLLERGAQIIAQAQGLSGMTKEERVALKARIARARRDACGETLRLNLVAPSEPVEGHALALLLRRKRRISLVLDQDDPRRETLSRVRWQLIKLDTNLMELFQRVRKSHLVARAVLMRRIQDALDTLNLMMHEVEERLGVGVKPTPPKPNLKRVK